MSNDSMTCEACLLLVREAADQYRPAEADEVLRVAQCLILRQLRGRELMTSPQEVRDFLCVKLGVDFHVKLTPVGRGFFISV